MPAQPISSPATPITKEHLVADLRALGLDDGATVMVHTSLRSLGWVIGGAQTVLEALREAVGEAGTIVMPSQSWQLCDPAFLQEAPEEWWPTIRENLPFYDPATSPSQTMGIVAELFRTTPGACRSPHPNRSVAAVGPKAARITATHPFDAPVGEESPLAALVALEAQVLLLGVGAGKMTALHLAEYRASYPSKRTIRNGVAQLIDGKREWVAWDELDVHDEDFVEVADAFAGDTDLVRRGVVGNADAQLIPVRPLVDYATEWFTENRK